MRRQPTELRSQGTRVRSRDEARGASKQSRLRRLALEALEGRTLMATAPLPVVSNQADISGGDTQDNFSSPLVAINPINPQEVVAVYTDRNTSNGTHFFASASFSTDGGKTWGNLNLPGPRFDPTVTSNPPPLSQYPEGVGFDRNNNLYIGLLETNAGNTGGYVLVEKYNSANSFSNSTSPTNEALVYTWDQAATGQNTQPGVVNFSMAVDANVASFTDPTTLKTQGDPNSGSVYISWTAFTPPPQNPPNPYNPYTIQVVASPDGTTWPGFGPGGDNGAVRVGLGNAGNQRYTAPEITVSQGKVNGTDGGQISVVWDDYASGNNASPPVDLIDFAALNFALNPNSGTFVLSNPTGFSTIAFTSVRGALGAPFPLSTPSSPIGIGPGVQIAVDNTLGSFSPHQGRIYVTYVDRYTADAKNPADNTDIFLIASDDDGRTWFDPNSAGSSFSNVGLNGGEQVNTDSGVTDGHTGAVFTPNDLGVTAAHPDGRPQYEPSIAVDRTTGSVVLSWLDVRDDAALARYSNYLTTSIDGGATYSPQNIPSTEYTASQLAAGVPQPFADQPNLVTDAITGEQFVAGAYSGNESGSNPNAETSVAFGVRQGLAVANGVIIPVWATTVMDGFQGGGFNGLRTTIESARATLPAGPRIISGTMGPVVSTTVDGLTFNNTFSSDHTQQINGFTVTFDRPVSIASFTAAQVKVQFLSAATDTTSTVGLAASNPVTALDPQGAGNREATTFFVRFAVPQSGVGTYSYAVGPGITDLMRTSGTPTIVTDPSATLNFSTPNTPQPIKDIPPAATSTITVSGVPNGDFIQNVSVNLTLNYPTDANLQILLTAPSGQTVTLASGNGGAGANYTNTSFSDSAPQSIAAGTAPFTGAFRPLQALSTLVNGPINGDWTLTVVDTATGTKSGALTNWSLNITPQTPAPGLTLASPTNLPAPIGDAPPPTTSSITVSGAPAADVAAAVSVNLSINYPNDSNLQITLTSPGGTTITLASGVGGGGSNFTNTTFSDGAATPIAAGTAPFTGTFRPAQPLAAFIGGPINGKWTLTVIDTATGTNLGSLASWSLNITPGKELSTTASNGNPMDQNANGVAGEASDVFADPTPTDPTLPNGPFAGSYDTATLPLIIPGPHLVSTFVPGGTADPDGSAQAGNNLVLNGTVSSIDVTFDRNMDPTTLVGGNPVLSITGPTGAIDATNFVVVADPQAGEDPAHPRTYKIEFFKSQTVAGVTSLVPAVQSLSGTYSVVLATQTLFPNNTLKTIQSQSGAAVDTNQNAGVNFLFSNELNGVVNNTSTFTSSGPQTIFLGFFNFPNTSTITVPASSTDKIQDFSLALNIANPSGQPMTATLTTPSGKIVTLFTNITTTSLNNIILTDSAAGPLTNGATTGTFQPQQSFLTAGGLLNASEAGAYTLTITGPNTSSFTTGTLSSWSITTTHQPSVSVAQVTASGGGGAISNAAPLVSTITIPVGENYLIQDFGVDLNITYPNDPDLTATLTTPAGKTITLFSKVGNAAGSKANFTNTAFDDHATTPIANGAPPFFGLFQPQAPFLSGANSAQLAGVGAAGTYTLTITDSGPGTGTLTGWSIAVAPQVTANSGLGETVADQSTASFRIFTMDPTNPLSSNTWTPVGPASNNGNANSGRVSSVTVDPSDPSGNTVYVAGASGGLWKTTDFLTTAAGGPTYTLLTGAAAANALNIGSVAVYGRNGDPNQSIVVVGTGEGNTAFGGVEGSSTVGTSAGVGFLISYDGGKTWTLDDSLSNYDNTGAEIPESKRDRNFVGTTTFKVLVDPNPEPNGNIIIYAALGGAAPGAAKAQGGVYRSIDSGKTWQLMRAGYATDIAFDLTSATVNAVSNPTGNVRVLYAGFKGDGVYLTPNQGASWSLMAGGVGDPLIQDAQTPLGTPVKVNNPPTTPNGGSGRIVLAHPAPTGNALLDAQYETWLYAATVDPSGQFLGLFVTKDNGLNWTNARIPSKAFNLNGTYPKEVVPTNDIGQPNYNITVGQGTYDFAIAVDPNNPQVVYVGGTRDGQPSTLIRVDITRLSDPYSLYSSTQTAGGQSLENTTSPVSIYNPKQIDQPQAFPGGFNFPDPLSNPFTNLVRNPNTPFTSFSTIIVDDTSTLANDGSGAWWTPFTDILNGETDIHAIQAVKDPTTGKTRLLVGLDQGVFSGIDDGDGTVLSAIGDPSAGGTILPTGSRNGNLQITQFYNGASQPSVLAAQIASALFYGQAQDDGFPESNPGLLTNGDIGWNGIEGDGTDVATDATGSGTSYFSKWPCCINGFESNFLPNTPTDFFEVNPSGQGLVGRTLGLIQSSGGGGTGGGLTGTTDPQWPYGPSFNFAVNPVNNQDMIFGSGAGRLFGTENQGQFWFVLADPSVFDGSTIPALAYGAPDPGAALNGNLGNYMLAGTSAGHVFVSFTGGGGGTGGLNSWTNISAGLDGSSVERIVTDPTRGTHDAYAITLTGVFYNPDTSAAGSSWTNITGDLFKQTYNPFGDATLNQQQLQILGGLAVDWRYIIPNNPSNPAKGTHPMLYVAGLGGVFRSTNQGANWTAFPDQTLATPVVNGNLPTTSVTDLDMVLGNVDPTTGHPNVATGPNVLLATTYGDGSYGIRLAPIVFNDNVNKVAETQSPSGTLTFTGLSEQSAFGNAVAVTVVDVTDPNNPIFLGGYNPSDGAPSTSPTFANKANETNSTGNFSVSGNYPTAPQNNPFIYDGARTIALFATDASGTKGNVVTFKITNNLPTPAGPVFINSSGATSPLTNAVVSNGAVITTPATLPTFAVTLPGTGITATVNLIRIDGQGNTVVVAQSSLTGSGTIQDPGPVPVGTYTYEITYTVPINGQATDSPVSPTTTVKVVPAQTIGLYYQDDSGTVGDGITNVQRPRFVGTSVPNTAIDANLTVQLVVTSAPAGSAYSVGQVLASAVDPANGQFLLQPSAALADGTYGLAVRTKDAAGDSVTSAPLTLTISTAGPKMVPTLALLPSSIVPPNNPNVTVVRRPTVFGYTDPGATVTITGSVNGGAAVTLAVVTASQFKNGSTAAGYFQAQLPSNLNDGTVVLFARASNASGNTNPTPGTLGLRITSLPGDYTGVGKAGLAVYVPSNGDYDFAHAGTAVSTFVRNFGLANVDIPVPGDYNGDGQTDPAIYRPSNGYWAIDANSQATGQFVIYIPPIVPPGPNVVPAQAEYDLDGQTDPAVYSIVGGYGYFTILHSLVASGSNSATQTVAWGLSGDTPVPADYDAAGSAQVAVYRPSTGAWYIRSSGVIGGAATPPGKQEPPIFVTAYQAGDVPVPGDYDGIGRAEEAIFRPSNQTFYIYNPLTKTTRSVTMPKLAGQGTGDLLIPAPLDYTGDGKVDPTIFDQNLGTYEYVNSATGLPYVQPYFETAHDIPPQAPYQYRAAANTAAPAYRTSPIFASAPGGSGSAASPAFRVAGSASTAAPAIVLGAATPSGSTSTGKSSTLPPAPTPTPAPIALITAASSVGRPAQSAADSAIAALGKAYGGKFL